MAEEESCFVLSEAFIEPSLVDRSRNFFEQEEITEKNAPIETSDRGACVFRDRDYLLRQSLYCS